MKNYFFPILLLAVSLLGTSCMNSTDSSNINTAVEIVDLRVLYNAIENPIKVAVSSFDPSELIVSVDNGTISGEKGEYIIIPNKTGTLNLTVSNNGTEIRKKTFRVDGVPEPFAGIVTPSGIKRGGILSKRELLDAGEITAELPEWFLYDIDFKVISFVLSTTVGKYEKKIKSNSASFTEEMIDQIKGFKKDHKFYVTEIIAVGPDGLERELSTVMFKIEE